MACLQSPGDVLTRMPGPCCQQLVSMAVTLQFVGKANTPRHSCSLRTAAGGGGVGIDVKIGLEEERRKKTLPALRLQTGGVGLDPEPGFPGLIHGQAQAGQSPSLFTLLHGVNEFIKGSPSPLATQCPEVKTRPRLWQDPGSQLLVPSTCCASARTVLRGGSLVTKPSSWVTWGQGVGFCILPFRQHSHIEKTIIE